MKYICLDMRDNALRVLVFEDGAVAYAKRFEPFSLDDQEQADRHFAAVVREAGVKFDRVHCIVRPDLVSTTKQSIPLMSRADALKVIRRKLVKDGEEAPLFDIVPAESAGDRQSYLVESIKRETAEKYKDFFQSRGVHLRSLSTPLQANLRVAGSLGEDISRVAALIDIGDDVVEVSVLSGGRVMSHAKVILPVLDREKELSSGKTADRIEKVRVYQVAEAVFNALANYKKEHADDPIQALWLCGTGSVLPGVLEALQQSMEAEVRLMNAVDSTGSEGVQFTALKGLALGLADGTAANFLPRDLARRNLFTAVSRPARAAIAVLTVFVLLAVISIIELRHHRLRLQLDAGRQPFPNEPLSAEGAAYSKQSGVLHGMVQRQITLSGILGYLADQTPDGVYIDGVAFSQKSAAPRLEVDFVTPDQSGIGAGKYLTRITAMMDRLSTVRRTEEPVITITKQDKTRLHHFKITCEVEP